MSFDAVLSDLRIIYKVQPGELHCDRNHLTEDDIGNWCALVGQPRAVLFDQIAIWLARGFHNSELAFEFCDAVVNDILGIITSGPDPAPKLFWKIYLAFD